MALQSTGTISLSDVITETQDTPGQAISISDASVRYLTRKTNSLVVVDQGNTTNAYLGYSVAVSRDGSTLVAGAATDDTGALLDTGSAYVYIKSGDSWVMQAKLIASDASVSDTLGAAVTISDDGSTIAIGALNEDNDNGVNAGSVYVFVRSGTTWSQQQKIVGDTQTEARNFGYRVSISGDGNTLAVTDREESTEVPRWHGSVYIFNRTGTTWSKQTRFFASDATTFQNFGQQVSINSGGDTIAVGAPGNHAYASVVGSVYVFSKSGSVWTQQTKLQASVSSSTGRFGKGIGITSDGNTLVIGAEYDDKAYVFQRSGSTWSEQTILQPSSASSGFGFSIDVSDTGDLVAIGAYRANISYPGGGVGTFSQAGRVHLFSKSGTMWVQVARIEATAPNLLANFGLEVSLSGNGTTLAVGAPFEDSFFGARAGYVHVYDCKFIGPVSMADLYGKQWLDYVETNRIRRANPLPGDGFGKSVAIDGSGATLVVGAPYEDADDGSKTDQGYVYVYGDLNTTASTATKLFRQAGTINSADYFGASVALNEAGTILAVGAPYAEGVIGKTNGGAVFIYDRTPGTNNWTSRGSIYGTTTQSDTWFGESIALSADGNTIVVGSVGYGAQVGANSGMVYVLFWNGTTWTSQGTLQPSDTAPGDLFGHSVAVSSDGNTLIASATGKTFSTGATYVFTRTGSTWSQVQKIVPTDAQALDFFGGSVSISGDASTIVAASSGAEAPATEAGAFYVFVKSGSTWTQTQKLTGNPVVSGANVGGVRLSRDGSTIVARSRSAGYVYVYKKVNNLYQFVSRLRSSDYTTDDYYAESVALNNDGNILPIGAQSKRVGSIANAGAAYVFRYKTMFKD